MLLLLSAVFSTLCSTFRSLAALELEHIALRHQIGVLKRSARKRPKLTAADAGAPSESMDRSETASAKCGRRFKTISVRRSIDCGLSSGEYSVLGRGDLPRCVFAHAPGFCRGECSVGLDTARSAALTAFREQ
jgi:hypothetical protein